MVNSKCHLDRIQYHLRDGTLGMPIGDYLDYRGGKTCPLWAALSPGLDFGVLKWRKEAKQRQAYIPLCSWLGMLYDQLLQAPATWTSLPGL